MEVVQTKYKNFQGFCLELLPNNEFVALLQKASLELFLKTIRIKRGQMKTETEIMDAIMAEGNINRAEFTAEQLNKFARYVKYFTEVIDCLE